MTIADTDVLIDFLKDRGEAARVQSEIEAARLCTTVITAFELWAGAGTPHQLGDVDTLLGALIILTLDSAAAQRAGQIQRDLARKGTPIAMADSLIAGICLEYDATLLTRNLKHFQRVPGLQLG